jgi:SAM-dependent methyltransferase
MQTDTKPQSPPQPPRPRVEERPSYVPIAQQERFIVPLLRNRIEGSLEKFAKPPTPKAKMLDVGCGRHPFRQFIESLGYTYYGCDVNQSPEGTVDFLFAIDAAVPPELAAMGPFELLLCTEVLEHVADWEAAFKNMTGLLSDTGLLLITAPHFYQLHEVPYDFWRPTLYAIEYFSNRHGLKVVHSEAAGDGWDVLGTVLANCNPMAKNRKFLDLVLARIARGVKGVLFSMMARGKLQATLRMEGPLYISNIALVRKAAAVGK